MQKKLLFFLGDVDLGSIEESTLDMFDEVSKVRFTRVGPFVGKLF